MPDEPHDEPRIAEDLASFLAAPRDFAPPELMGVAEAVDKLLALYESSGGEGATYSLHFGDMTGQPYYSVSVWPNRTLKVLGGVLEIDTLLLFVQMNIDLLNDARCGVGLWSNGQVTYCDVVALLPSEQEATALAVRYDQIAIFDLHALTEIETGGTGNTPLNMPPDAQRLLEINSEEGHL